MNFTTLFSENFLEFKNIQPYSRFTDKGPSIAEPVIKTVRKILKKLVFQASNADWVSELLSTSILSKNTIHSTTKMKPNDDSKKASEKEVYCNLQD